MEAETQILQVHHGELGGLIARHWNLPEPIVNGITFHHNPEMGGDSVCDVVHVANVVAKLAQAKLLSKESSASINPDAAERLGLVPEKLEGFVDETVTSFSKVGGLFGAA